MADQSIFKRYELKYMLTLEQKQRILAAMRAHMALDKYGRTTIRNIYYDTPDYRLIRRSIEKPAYKEKLRIRAYRRSGREDKVFVELKKKYQGVVYKRRLSCMLQQASDWLAGSEMPQPGQIASEISYFRDFYGGLRPTVFLSYEREAYYSLDGSDFRVTFDDHILCSTADLSLDSTPGGDSLLPEGKVLMEVKTSGAVPLWMTKVLSDNAIYMTSFSKYGTAYQTLIFPKLKGEVLYA